jgi:hypothetical protein
MSTRGGGGYFKGEGKKIRSTLIHLGIGISLPKLNCRCNSTYYIHKMNFQFSIYKTLDATIKKPILMPDLQKTGGLEMGENSFGRNSFTVWNFQKILLQMN